jgi:hypothetical protein
MLRRECHTGVQRVGGGGFCLGLGWLALLMSSSIDVRYEAFRSSRLSVAGSSFSLLPSLFFSSLFLYKSFFIFNHVFSALIKGKY